MLLQWVCNELIMPAMLNLISKPTEKLSTLNIFHIFFSLYHPSVSSLLFCFKTCYCRLMYSCTFICNYCQCRRAATILWQSVIDCNRFGTLGAVIGQILDGLYFLIGRLFRWAVVIGRILDGLYFIVWWKF